MILVLCYTVLILAQLAKLASYAFSGDRFRLLTKWLIALTVAAAYAGLLGANLHGK